MNNAAETLAVHLPWQQTQWQQLTSMHADGRLPHALLLTGTSGTGKERFALALAHYLMCQSPASSTPCGQCRQCGFNKAGTHPDLKQLRPEEKGRLIKIDQIRELVEFICQTSQQGGYKIAILSPAESMNINAANALLKSLEEPGSNTLLMLLSDAPGQLLATIRSRCQSVAFAQPDDEQALQWLQPLVSSREQAGRLLAETPGRPLAALALLETDGISRFQQMNNDFLAMLNSRQLALSVAQKWLEYDPGETLAWMGRRLSAVIRSHYSAEPLDKPWRTLAHGADIQAVFALLDKVYALKAKISQGANPNQQLALEALLLESCDVFHSF